jgi:hypothetical protein
MNLLRHKLLLAVVTFLFLFSFAVFAADQQKGVQGPFVIHETHHDVSPPFRDMPPLASGSLVTRVIPVRPVPLPPGAANAENASHDPNVQNFVGAIAIPSTTLNFEGTDYPGVDCNCAPPDTNGAVGPNHYVQLVNTAVNIFSKTGVKVSGFPKALKSIWSGFSNPCSSTDDGDPVVVYDQLSGHWVLSQFSVSSTPYYECVAVSTGTDPTGTYNRYEFSFGNNFPDYPKVGVWPDAYYVTYNLFTNTFVGSEVCAMNRSAMIAGTTASQVCFTTSSSFGSLLPANVDGGTVPPSGSPEFVVNFGTNSLRLWRFHVNFSGGSTFTGPTTIPVNSFAAACSGGSCIPQPGTSNKLDSLADRLMHRFVYRNFGDHESLLVNHSVLVSKAKGKELDGIRWYELRNTPPSTSATPVVYQQATYAPSDGISRWMGSIAMDKLGDIGLGFSVSNSSSVFPGIRYTGRLAGDPLNTLNQGEAVITNGTGSQTGTLHRWGDYSALALDPSDGCTFWYTTEYIKSNGSFNWSTRIGSFKVNSACN